MEPRDPGNHTPPVCKDAGASGSSLSWELHVLVQRAHYLAGSLRGNQVSACGLQASRL